MRAHHFILAIALVLALFSTSAVQATTLVEGDQFGTWSPDGNPYWVINDIIVPVGDVLIIEPGVEVYFADYYSFEIYGQILAEGTETDNILFTSLEPYPQPGDWNMINLSSSSLASTFDYCIFEYCSTGIRCYNCDGGNSISNTTFSSFNDIAIDNYISGDVNVTNCDIDVSYGNYGIKILDHYNSGSHVIANCSITSDGEGVGVYTQAAWGTSYHNINHCTISNMLLGMEIHSMMTGSVVIDGCELDGNNIGIKISYVDNGSILNTRVTNSVSNGIYVAGDPYDDNTIIIQKCIVAGSGMHGIKFNDDLTFSTVENCTIFGNTGRGIDNAGSDVVIVNCIIAGNTGFGIRSTGEPAASIEYSDWYGNNMDPDAPQNDGGDGVQLDGFGLLVGMEYDVNANGDPCDVYNNIWLDPVFVNSSNGNYRLASGSPCIDAGDPLSPLDPDYTIADMGALYFDIGDGILTLAVTPWDDPIIIPPNGGNFRYDVVITNVTDHVVGYKAWTQVVLPNGNLYGPVLYVDNLSIDPYEVLNASPVQNVPGFAPSGIYIYTVKLGMFASVFATDYFAFGKMQGSAANMNGGTWDVSGWDAQEFAEDTGDLTVSANVPVEFGIGEIYPNPFNPTTTISISMPSSADLKVSVFNVLGQQVAVLANARYTEGYHSLTFDGSKLSGGVYFVQAVVPGEMNEMQKVVLVK